MGGMDFFSSFLLWPTSMIVAQKNRKKNYDGSTTVAEKPDEFSSQMTSHDGILKWFTGISFAVHVAQTRRCTLRETNIAPENGGFQ